VNSDGQDRTSPPRAPLDHWTYRGYRRATDLGICSEFIEEARDIVVGAFGRDWLTEQLSQAPQGFRLVYDGHPLVESFLVAGDPQIVEVIELAVYLKRLAGVRRLDQVVTMMRQRGQFESSMMQLAYAYRFQKAGAQVELEPDATAGRRSDIGLLLDGHRFLAECYVPTSGRKSALSEIVDYSVPKLFRAAKHHGIKARIRIVFSREPRPGERTVLERSIRDAISQVATDQCLSVDVSWATISVSDISGVDPDPDYPDPQGAEPTLMPEDGDAILSEISVDPRDVERVKDGSAVFMARGSRFIFKWPQLKSTSIDERVEELKDKFDEKLQQTKKEGAGRILIAQVKEGQEMNAEDEEVARRLQERLLGRHKRIGALILTSRKWTTANRYRYHGYVLYGPSGLSVLRRAVRVLSETDGSGDVLNDWR
jgi:hypothetical protein